MARSCCRSARIPTFHSGLRARSATEARRLIAAGIDPGAKRKAELQKKRERFESFVFPYIGKRRLSDIKAPDLLALLRKMEARCINETAHHVRSECGSVFRYAITTGRADRDPAADLRGALAPVVTRNHPAITDPAKIGELLRAIHGYRGRGHQSTELALRLLPLVFVRPGELRAAEWAELTSIAPSGGYPQPA